MRAWTTQTLPILAFALSCTPGWAQGPECLVDGHRGQIPLWECSTWHRGDDTEWATSFARGEGLGFEATAAAASNRGYTSEVFWIHTRVRFLNPGRSTDWLLVHHFRYTHDLRIWVRNLETGILQRWDGGVRELTGEYSPMETLLGSSFVRLVSLAPAAPSSLEFLIRIHADSATELSMFLENNRQFSKFKVEQAGVYGASIGLLLLLVVVAWNLRSTTRQAVFGYFSVHILTFLLAQADVVNLFGLVLGEGWLARRFNHFAYCISASSFLMFIACVLRLSNSRPALPLVLKVASWGVLAFLPALALTSVPISGFLTSLACFLAMATFYTVVIVSWFQKVFSSHILVLAGGVFVLGVVTHIATRSGFLPLNFLSENAVILAIIIESVFLLLAVRNRYVSIEIDNHRKEGELANLRVSEATRRLELVLGIADRLNSPVTALISFGEILKTRVAKVHGLITCLRGSSEGKAEAALVHEVEMIERQQRVFNEAVGALGVISRELSVFRESAETVDSGHLAFPKGKPNSSPVR